MTRLYGLLAILMLSGCAGFVPEKPGLGSVLGFLNSYEAALEDYKKGRIMTARARIRAMDKTREDYPQALKLLKQKVEPARLRLLKHYSAKAGRAEKAGKWSRAMMLYAEAAELSIKPATLNKKRSNMELKMRQARMDYLITRRRAEDSKLLVWLNDYETPKEVAPQDEVFTSTREHLRKMIEARGDIAYREAKRYLKEGFPEIAYIEAESYSRLVPASKRDKGLKSEVRAAIPKGIRIASIRSKRTKKVLSQRVVIPDAVQRQQVAGLIREGSWVEARKFARVYRRSGGKDADELLKQIQSGAGKEASTYFAQGRLAFRKEQLGLAIEFWEKAVTLMPEQSEYSDALRRARQLQERLSILQSDAESEIEAETKTEK